MIHLLLVDDNKDFVLAMKAFLSRKGYEAQAVFAVDEAYDAMYRIHFDLIVSDIMMPGTNGFQFAAQVRSMDEKVPILFISAREDLEAKQKGFQLGIDDYMVKPIDFEELEMRIKALLRRAGITSEKKITVGDTILDQEEHTAYVKGEEVPLTTREFDILFKMLSYPKKTFSRQQLMDEFWDVDSSSTSRSVDVYMTKLRDKFSSSSDFEIKTVHGLGYKVILS